ncbi:DUF2505 domain-containing protein [Brevibacterium spongiae]|uniref:DUF2505 domain-containing protein n=1 Tax=Brevibacterium spongiae TaxID=2909672 RepID=A0ABY5SXL7_9MICO|nr:DUF2505 domain-containing protein [Brevibacterium spongiae]UVI37444.1 DUF2505 domain-containing protein [Brevibacterium spongiae]
MRTLTLSHDYSVDLQTFLATLADCEVWEKLGSEASSEHIDPDTEMTVRTPMPKSDLPSALASRLPNETELVEVYMIPGDVLGDDAEIRMSARAAGVPVEIDAVIELHQVGSQTKLTAHAEISSSIPMFGAMIEQAVVPILDKRLSERLRRFETL